MKHTWIAAVVFAAFALTSTALAEEQISTAAGETTVPRLIKFSGTLKDSLGSPRAGQVVMTFALYTSQEGGEVLWRESHLVKLDEEGRYTIFLGASEKEGLPLQLFSAEKAQWLGVQPEGEIEQARVVLVAVPYALKAADADSVGGQPMSSFVLNNDWVQAGGDFNAYKAILQQRGVIGPDGKLAAQSGASLNTLASQDGGGGVIQNALEGASNTFYGEGTGAATTGLQNSFFGSHAGWFNTSGYDNSFFGFWAGINNNTGYDNSFFGNFTGAANTTGYDNSFFGGNAGFHNTTGGDNSFFGQNAGNANTTGWYNSFFGTQAGYSNTAGGSNSFFGNNAGFNSTTADDNSFFGNSAGYANTTGNSNSFFGGNAGLSNTTGGSNSFVGYQAGNANTTGNANSFFGNSAGLSNTTGSLNSFFGTFAGSSNTTGGPNSFFGYAAGYFNTTGNYNSFFGYSAGGSNTTGNNNSFFGYTAGSSNTTGGSNSFFGREAGQNNTTGNTNSLFGYTAGYNNTTGASNSFFGNSAGYSNTTGGSNTFFGDSAGYYSTIASDNSFFGRYAGYRNIDGYYNSFFGSGAGYRNTTGVRNAFLGHSAGYFNTTGILNTIVGDDAGLSNTVENNNTFIGHASNGFIGITNATALGYRAQVTQSNSLVLGSIAGVNGATVNTNVGIGTTAPQAKLHVEGNAYFNGNVSFGTVNSYAKLTFQNDSTVSDPIAMIDTAPGGRSWRFGGGVGGAGLFTIRDDTAGANRFSIRSDGNIGIGTTNAYAKLTFAYDSTVSDPIAMIDTAPGGRSWRFGGGVGGAGLFTIRDDTAAANRLTIASDGNVGIGTTNPTEKLQVVGNIKVSGTILYGASAAEEVPDYVFEPGYALMPVQELENYLASEKHLPSVPSAAEIKQNGLNLSEFQMKLLKKIEELTLYIVQQAKVNDLQAKAIDHKDEEMAKLKSQNLNLDTRLAALEQLLSMEGQR